MLTIVAQNNSSYSPTFFYISESQNMSLKTGFSLINQSISQNIYFGAVHVCIRLLIFERQ